MSINVLNIYDVAAKMNISFIIESSVQSVHECIVGEHSEQSEHLELLVHLHAALQLIM